MIGVAGVARVPNQSRGSFLQIKRTRGAATRVLNLATGAKLMHHPLHHAPFDTMTKILSIRGAARQLGKSHSTICRYVQAHPALNRGTARRPLVDLEELRRHRASNIDAARIGSHAGLLLGEDNGVATNGHAAPAPDQAGGSPSYADSKATREAILATKAQLDLDERLGALLVRSEVEEAIAAAGQLLQRELLDLAGRLAEKIAVMDDRREIAALLDTEFRALLKRVAAALASWE